MNRGGRRVPLSVPENIFNAIVNENFPNLKKDIPIQVLAVYRTPNRVY